MKNIANEIGGNIKYEESKKRLVITVSDIKDQQYKKLVDQLVHAVRERKATSCLWDAINRDGAKPELEQYTVKNMNKAMELGLKHIALVNPERQQDKKIGDQFISGMNSASVRAFDSKQEAEQWLDQAGGQQRRAA